MKWVKLPRKPFNASTQNVPDFKLFHPVQWWYRWICQKFALQQVVKYVNNLHYAQVVKYVNNLHYEQVVNVFFINFSVGIKEIKIAGKVTVYIAPVRFSQWIPKKGL